MELEELFAVVLPDEQLASWCDFVLESVPPDSVLLDMTFTFDPPILTAHWIECGLFTAMVREVSIDADGEILVCS